MNEADVRDFYAAIGRRDFERVAAFLAEDVLLVFPGRRLGAQIEGQAAAVEFWQEFEARFLDGLTFHIDWVGIVDERIVVQWNSEGRTQAQREYANQGVTVMTMRGGLIRRLDVYLDTEVITDTWPLEAAQGQS